MDVFSPLHLVGVVGMAAGLLLLAGAARVIYNLFFHPLARFPGPILWRATRLTFTLHLLRGDLARVVLDLHIKYGPVVRIAPNELAFSDADAWRSIYGHRTGDLHGQKEMGKYKTFYITSGNKLRPSIISEDHDRHTVLRRQLAHGFSDKSLRAQEGMIGGYINLLIQRLHENCFEKQEDADGKTTPRKPKPLEMTSWYNWTTFDVIGDLAFGEPFGCLEKGEYDPWVAAVNESVRTTKTVLALKYMGLDYLKGPIMKWFQPARKLHFDNTSAKLKRRMALQVERPDLIEGLIRKKEAWDLDFYHLQSNASTLIVAGSETTATLLSGVTYLLLKNPDKLAKLVDEVRSSFKSEDEIDFLSASRLTYMLACLDEALRCYPPVPSGMPRVTPKGGATVLGERIPENTVVAVWQWATYHNPALWKDPFGYHPERFLNDPAFQDDKLDALQPFSVGPRNCIGKNLAYSEMRIILARIIFNFDMRLADESAQDDWMDQKVYFLWAKKPLNVIFTPVSKPVTT